MIPISLKISGFLSYREQVILDFTTFDLACIAGNNGAGKSSILDAITWALFGQARKRDDSLINSHPQVNRSHVEFIYGYEGNTFRVVRTKTLGKSTTLEFNILQNGKDGAASLEKEPKPEQKEPIIDHPLWKPLTERTLRDTQSRIEETLKLDYETFINASFFLQGKADQFTQQRPADRKRILSTILGLEIWETYRQRTSERRNRIEKAIDRIDGQLNEIINELSEEEERKTQLKALLNDLTRLSTERKSLEQNLEQLKKIITNLEEQRKLLETLAGQLETSSAQIAELERNLISREEERQQHEKMLSNAEEIEDNYAQWQITRQEYQQMDRIARQFMEQEKRRHKPLTAIETERVSLKNELNGYQKKESEIVKMQSLVPELHESVNEKNTLIEKLQQKIEQRTALDQDLQAARDNLATANAENPRLKEEMEALKERITHVEKEDGVNCPLCGQRLNPDDRQNLIEELNTSGKHLGDRFRNNRNTMDEAKGLVSDLKMKISALVDIENDLLIQSRELERLNQQLESSEEQIKEWDSTGGKNLKSLAAIIEGNSYAADARKELKAIDDELIQIGYDAVAHDKIREAEENGRSSEIDLRELASARAASEPLSREINEKTKRITELKKEHSNLSKVHSEAQEVFSTSLDQAPDLNQAQNELNRLQESENRARLMVGAAQQKVDVLDTLKSRKADLEDDRLHSASQVSSYKQLERAFGKDGVPALLIEQALPQIENKANELLTQISSTDMSIRFITQRSYKDKKRKDLRETLDIQISDNVGKRDYEMFSGGEAFKVNFAIRLALSEVLAQRAGARLQTLVIDEGFGSQDALGRQRLIEAINRIRNKFAKILVITHIDEMIDAFPTKLMVEKTAQGSTITVL